jgi:phosphoketolase
MSAFQHFATAYPDVTNSLPVLVWNGYSQEHHSMVSLWDNGRMAAYWRAHGFDEVHLVDARDFADTPDAPVYADSTTFGFAARMAFTGAILKAADAAAKSALSGRRACLIVKQLKGAGVHATGAKSHNLYAHHTLDSDDVKSGLQRRALPVKAWELVRENFRHAGGGPAARVAVTETARELPSLEGLPLTEFTVGENHIPTTAFGHVVGEVGKRDPLFVVTNADGNEASGMANINKALTIRHPTADDLYFQGPAGQVYEPLNEDACAGLAVGVALFGGRSLWCSYESFAINGLPIWQTVTQAMAELRRPTPATVCLFTAGALEQGRNGWTHQAPRDRKLLRRDDAQRQRLPAVPGRRQHDPGELRLGAQAIEQGHRHHRVEVAAAGPRHAGAELSGDRRGRDGAEGNPRFAHRGVRGDRRSGAAAGVRRRREARRDRHRLAHRRRGQPAPPVPPDRRAVGQRVGARRPLHGDSAFRACSTAMR